jgi:hypothetical protein
LLFIGRLLAYQNNSEMDGHCTMEEFVNFFHAKAFDVVGNGSFKKHLTKCKDAGDPWAVEMAQHIQNVQAQIKEIGSVILAMPQTSNRLHEICKDVMVGAQPPTKLHGGCVTCSITQQTCMRCLDLSKTHKSSKNLFVDARFCLFFMLLWFCNKIEYIIRSFTRTWLDSRKDTETFQELCHTLQVDLKPKIEAMYRLFVMGKEHVLKTLRQYEKTHKLMLVV